MDGGNLFTQAVLTHCYNGTNYFTGEGGGVETDYLSFHLKVKLTDMGIY